ncbi:MAG: hypothetical protein M3Y55_01790 [Pseudomonadota bacterium]|nr:hypothetical protein [Pseudomonadota bacterium]
MDPSQPYSPSGLKAVNEATDTAQGTLDSTRQALRQGLDGSSMKADDVRDTLKTAADASARLRAAADRGKDMLNDAKTRATDTARQAQNAAASYAKEEPVKTLLMAAAAGAALMGLVTLMLRSDD